MTYDKTYRTTEHVFGSQPETILEKYVGQIDKCQPVLDIGIGQGRNAFYLAHKGFRVDGIDLSEMAIKSVSEISRKENLNIQAYQKGFHEFVPEKTPYSAILVFGLIQILDWNAIHQLLNRIDQWTKKGSLVFITAFSTKDATFKKYSNEWKEVGKNSFGDNRGNVRTFLDPDEILELFNDYHIVYHWEGTGPKHRHGDGPLEQHAMIELVVAKK
jgi:cyclopropane fatty-acyl-phospholipid synthase-like methyltransferase